MGVKILQWVVLLLLPLYRSFKQMLWRVICGHHICKQIWWPLAGEILTMELEDSNNHDKFTVSLLKAAIVIGHVPREFSLVFWHSLRYGGTITCEVTGWRKGLEIAWQSYFPVLRSSGILFVLRTTWHVSLNTCLKFKAHMPNTWWVKPSINCVFNKYYVLNRELHLTTCVYGNGWLLSLY